jgi:hypothetical protein
VNVDVIVIVVVVVGGFYLIFCFTDFSRMLAADCESGYSFPFGL